MAKKLKPEGQGPVLRKEVFDTLIRSAEELKGDASSAHGEFANFIKNAEGSHGVHRKAFQLVLQLRKVGVNEASKLADFLRAADLYRKWAGLDDLAGGDLFYDAEDAPPPKSSDSLSEEDALVAFQEANEKVAKKTRAKSPVPAVAPPAPPTALQETIAEDDRMIRDFGSVA